MSSFSIGNVVRLRSGGQKMTVNSVTASHARGSIECVWFTGKRSKMQREYLNPGAIEVVEGADKVTVTKAGNPEPTKQVTTETEEASTELLTLTQIAETLGVNYSRLQRYAALKDVRESVRALRVQGVQGGNGMRYPVSALAEFRRLFEAADKGIVTPKTAGTFLKGAA